MGKRKVIFIEDDQILEFIHTDIVDLLSSDFGLSTSDVDWLHKNWLERYKTGGADNVRRWAKRIFSNYFPELVKPRKRKSQPELNGA